MRWWQTNRRLKLTALIIATATWLAVSNITNDRRVVSGVPIEVRTRAGVLVLDQSASLADVEVRGTRNDIRQVQRDDFLVVLDLSRDARRGELTYRLGPSTVLAPRWVQPVSVQPGRLTVVVDELENRELPVEPELTGALPVGYEIERIELHPARVVVRGPATRLAQQSSVHTLPIDLTGRHTSFRERVELALDALMELPNARRWVEVDVRIRATSSQ
jgi:YbbR domain-containing protein